MLWFPCADILRHGVTSGNTLVLLCWQKYFFHFLKRTALTSTNINCVHLSDKWLVLHRIWCYYPKCLRLCMAGASSSLSQACTWMSSQGLREGAKGFIGFVGWVPSILEVSLNRPTTPQEGSTATPGVPGVPPLPYPLPALIFFDVVLVISEVKGCHSSWSRDTGLLF